MKTLFTVITFIVLLSGCAITSQEEYDSKKAAWEKRKIELKCVQQGEGYDPHFRHVEFNTLSPLRYTKWLCSDGKFHMSPFEFTDYLRGR